MSENPSKTIENKPWCIRKGGFADATYSDGDVEAVRVADDPVLWGQVTHVEHVEADQVPPDAVLLDSVQTLAKTTPTGRVELIHLAANPMLFARCDLLRKREDEDGSRQDIPTYLLQPPPPAPAAAPSRDLPVTPENGAPK